MTDENLLVGLKAGDSGAFEELFERFEAPLYRFFFYSHGGHHLAEDQCGDTFVALVSAIHGFRGGPEELRGFVYGVARNLLRRNRRRNRFRPVPLESALDVADPRAGPVRSAVAGESFRDAMRFIEACPHPVREVLLLRFVEGLALDEVAQALELPLNTVKSHIHRARKRMRERIEIAESDRKDGHV